MPGRLTDSPCRQQYGEVDGAGDRQGHVGSTDLGPPPNGAGACRVVAAGLQGEGEPLGVAERPGEGRDEHAREGAHAPHGAAASEVAAAGLLGLADTIELVADGGDEAQGQGEHEGEGPHRHAEAGSGESRLEKAPVSSVGVVVESRSEPVSTSSVRRTE